MREGEHLDVFRDDIVLLVQALSAAWGDRILAAVREAVGDDVRFNDGYVFQHLLAGPCSVTELAGRLGVSQQAMSKQVRDLERRELVSLTPDPDDGRVRRVHLAPCGRRAVEASRAARAELNEEIAQSLGPNRTAGMARALGTLSDRYGAVDVMARRRLRPEIQR